MYLRKKKFPLKAVLKFENIFVRIRTKYVDNRIQKEV